MRSDDDITFTGRPPDGSGFMGFVPQVPPHPDAVQALDFSNTTWSVEPGRRFGYILRAHGLGIPERSTAFALTRRGAERKARRWSRPVERMHGAYTPRPFTRSGHQPRATHAKPNGAVPVQPRPERSSPMQGETGKGYRR